MVVKQISVFLENVPGRLRAVTSILADNKINLRALTLADTSDFGVLRLIVDKPQDAVDILKGKNFIVKLSDVIAVEMDDSPGGLDSVLDALEQSHVNIEYMYAFASAKPGKALVIFRVDKVEEAVNSLKVKGIRLISSDEEIADLIYYCQD